MPTGRWVAFQRSDCERGDTMSGTGRSPTRERAIRCLHPSFGWSLTTPAAGLEGWVTVLWGLDDFFEYKTNDWNSRQIAGAPADAERQAALHAARWLMIPLTRAIDTLVIQVGQRPSRVHTVLERVAQKCQDFVEWHPVPAPRS